MATTSVSYSVTASGGSASVANPDFSYAAIPIIETSLLNHIDQLVVSVNGSALTPVTDYTVNEGTEVLTISSTIAAGDTVVLERLTSVDEPLVEYINNALLDSDNLNTSVTQLLYRLQELTNDILNTITLDISSDCWDGQGKRACNFANGTVSTDLTTLGQVTALIAGGDPMSVGDGIYTTGSGDDNETVFLLSTFPTTDVNAAKLGVFIDGVRQKPTADYSYSLNASSVPTVTFTTAPPTGTNNIMFFSVPGVVTTTYAAASLDGSVIIDNTLDGAALEDGTVDGDALVDGSVDLDKLTAGAGVADRVALFNTSGVPTAQKLTFSNVTPTGPSVRTDMTTVSDPDTITGSFGATTVTYTNDGSTTQFVTFSIQSQNGGGSVTLTPSGGSAITLGLFGGSGSANTRNQFSAFIAPDGVLRVIGSSGTNNLLNFVVQEV